jgi:hypothetical protein
MKHVAALVCGLLLCARGARAQGTTRSPHGPLSVECAVCHRPESWTAIRSDKFDHGKAGWPLEGAHAQVACRTCHKSLDFKGAPRACAGCHEDLHRGELGNDCVRCHTPRSFQDRTAMVRAHATTRFPLDGAHTVADCQACHKSAAQGALAFVGSPTRCEDCHMPSYVATSNPNHRAASYPTDCISCHVTSTWARARFDHSASGFPLTGAHAAVACDQCHKNNRFNGTPTACVACHQTDYNGTTDPAHGNAGFSTSCESCHTTATWQGAKFNHNASGFPLTGAHTAVACDQCHKNGRFSGTPTTCVACHQTDYNATTDPAHVSAGFSTSCESCHTTTTWQGAKFDHDAQFFPVYSGVHRGRWSSCSDCHTVANDFSQFTCAKCHTPAGMASKHRGVSGFGPNPQDCLRCHPTGRAG